MAKRIFRTMAISGVMAVLLTALLIVPALYRVYEARISNELRLEADYIAHALVMTDDMPAYLSEISSANRITLVAADGTVLYDSAAEPSVMENHSLRPEIAQAMAEGSGESMRRSDTISDTTNTIAIISAHHLYPILIFIAAEPAPKTGTIVIVRTVGKASPIPAHVLASEVNSSLSLPDSVIAGIIDQKGISINV